MATVTHPFVSAKADGGDATLVRPSNWNAGHTIDMQAVWSSVRNISRNNAATPLTIMDLNADYVTLITDDRKDQVTRESPAAITVDITTAGPAAGGRDQAGAFSANSWVYFYWIWNGTTLSGTVSVNGPETGPTLPGGYTFWCLAMAVRLIAGPNLRTTRAAGDIMWLEQRVSLLATGQATTETSIGMASVVPTDALESILEFQQTGNQNVTLRYITGSDFMILPSGNYGGQIWVPQVAQGMFYLFASAPTGSLNLLSLGYRIPNNGG